MTAFSLPSFPKPRLPSASDEGMKVWRGEGGHLRGGTAGPGGERPPAAARGNSGSADGANKRRRKPRAPRSPTRGRGVGAPRAGSGPRAPAPNTELVGGGRGKEAGGGGHPPTGATPRLQRSPALPPPSSPKLQPPPDVKVPAANGRRGCDFGRGCVCVCKGAPPRRGRSPGCRPCPVQGSGRAGGRQRAPPPPPPGRPSPPPGPGSASAGLRGSGGGSSERGRQRPGGFYLLCPALTCLLPGSYLLPPAMRSGGGCPARRRR